MTAPADNRAVTAMFRAWGGPERSQRGDAVRRLAGRGALASEAYFLSVLIPSVLAVAVVERLGAWFGPWWAALLALPAVVVAMHAAGVLLGILARFLTRMGGDQDAWGWRCWAAALSGWAGWAWWGGGWAKWVAAGWLLVVAINAVAALWLGWRRLMKLPGRPGTVLRVVVAVALHVVIVPLVFAIGWWGLGWAALLALFWARGTFDANSQMFGPVVARCDGGAVWLTIDDGPDPDSTPLLLELLDRHGAKATFFVIGQKVDRHAELAREIVARGHRVENHTGSHPVASFWAAGPSRTRAEIHAGSRSIEAATGGRPRWFRAPVGHANYFTHPVAAEAGMRVVGWTRRGFDGVSTNVTRIVDRVTRRLRGGEILVVHDATPVAEEVLRGVLERLKELGLRCDLPRDGEDDPGEC